MNSAPEVLLDGNDPQSGPAVERPATRARSAGWVPWVLLLGEFVVTAAVMGVLSVVVVVQLTLTPEAIFGEFDNILAWFVGRGVDATVEAVAAGLVFVSTGLIVGLLGLPIRLIGPRRRAWLGNGEVTVAGVVVGTLVTLSAYIFGDWAAAQGVNGTYSYYTPSLLPLVIGWLLLALSLSLLAWPARWMPAPARRWWVETQLTKHPG